MNESMTRHDNYSFLNRVSCQVFFLNNFTQEAFFERVMFVFPTLFFCTLLPRTSSRSSTSFLCFGNIIKQVLVVCFWITHLVITYYVITHILYGFPTV